MIRVAIDISNIFTNIPREMGIRQCTKHLDERSSCDRLFSTECIIKALEITLDYNVAAFNGITYRQERVLCDQSSASVKLLQIPFCEQKISKVNAVSNVYIAYYEKLACWCG